MTTAPNTSVDLPVNDSIKASRASLGGLKGLPSSFRLAAMMLLNTKHGRITFTLPDKTRIVFDNETPGADAVVDIHDYRFAKRSIAGGDIGFAESYMDGDWSTPDLTAVLTFFSENFEATGKLAIGSLLVRLTNMLRHVFNRNSKSGSKRNIEAHYDLGNDFYESWLDPSMTYSSALFTDPDMDLTAAQHSKYERISTEIGLSPGKSVLEIGCGWGGFAEYAAKTHGAKVTCLTISPSQRDYAMARMQTEGLNDLVEIRLEDYRDHAGAYDGVASIEMFEAVGEKYWPSYFSKIRESLKDNARAALQIITINDDLFESYRKRADFIQHYIFPGGMLPSETALIEQCDRAGLKLDDVHYFRKDYARTLRVWTAEFERHWPAILKMGFDERFRRMWNFYLSYCEAGFENGRINVGHFKLSRC